VIDFSSDGISSASNDTIDKNLIGDVEEDETVCGYTSRCESIGLARGSGESIKEPSGFLAVLLVKTVSNLLNVDRF
jgi:hypothetical protein